MLLGFCIIFIFNMPILSYHIFCFLKILLITIEINIARGSHLWDTIQSRNGLPFDYDKFYMIFSQQHT